MFEGEMGLDSLCASVGEGPPHKVVWGKYGFMKLDILGGCYEVIESDRNSKEMSGTSQPITSPGIKNPVNSFAHQQLFSLARLSIAYFTTNPIVTDTAIYDWRTLSLLQLLGSTRQCPRQTPSTKPTSASRAPHPPSSPSATSFPPSKAFPPSPRTLALTA